MAWDASRQANPIRPIAPNNTGRFYKMGYICGINFCGLIFFGLAFARPSNDGVNVGSAAADGGRQAPVI